MSTTVLIALGASAGGLKALEAFFRSLEARKGQMAKDEVPNAAFVVISHMDPNQKSYMDQLLADYTSLRVVQVADHTPVESGHVYVIPAGKSMTVSGTTLRLAEPQERRGMRHPIDHFLRSMADHFVDDTVAIILSGTGSDGMLGLKEVKGVGGVTMVQDPAEAEYSGMPQAAISTGMVDFSLSVEELAGKVLEYLERRTALEQATGDATGDTAPMEAALQEQEDVVEEILDHLHRTQGHDFSGYKRSTVNRRLHKRMLINGFSGLPDEEGHNGARGYLEKLKDDPDETRAMYRDLLIGVTSFFRDAEVYESLAENVMGELVRQSSVTDPVRIWVPGCSTGEEAYSIAMLLHEAADKAERMAHLQLFATDVDEVAIEKARKGYYPDSVAADVSEKRLGRYFQNEQKYYHVDGNLRDDVIFARHNLISDPPFIKLDLISCRNLLIYLSPESQKRIISLFFHSLKPEGYLLLGNSESLGSHARLFEAVDARHKKFRRKHTTLSQPVDFPVYAGQRNAAAAAHRRATGEGEAADDMRSLVEREQLRRFARPSVLVDSNSTVRTLYGDLDPWLRVPDGNVTSDLKGLARKHVLPHLRSALQRSKQQGEAVHMRAIRHPRRNDENFDLSVYPLEEHKGELYLVTFSPNVDDAKASAGAAEGAAKSADTDCSELVEQLEEQLKVTREQLQRTVEEHESADEELKSSNEDLMSMNEELQSTNEELETSREELQALNEELSSVNEELHAKVAELAQLNADVENLLNSTRIATLFLDEDLRIRRFTDPLEKIYNVVRTDMGRPITDLTGHLVKGPDPVEICREVVRTGDAQDHEMTTEDDTPWLVRFSPYRVANRNGKQEVRGVVVSFVDISERKQIEQDLATSVKRLDMALQATGAGVFDQPLPPDGDEALHHTSERFLELLGLTRETRPDMGDFDEWFMDRVLLDDREPVREAIGKLADGKVDRADVEFRFRVAEGQVRCLRIFGHTERDADGTPSRIVGLLMDVSQHKLLENELREHRDHLEAKVREASAQLSVIVDSSPAFISLSTLRDGEYRQVNPAFTRILGYGPEAVLGQSAHSLGCWKDPAQREHILEHLKAGDTEFLDEVVLISKDGSERTLLMTGRALTLEGEDLLLLIGIDISRQKQAELERDALLATVPDALYIFDEQGRFLFANRKLLDMWGLSADDAYRKTMADLDYPVEVEAVLREGYEYVLATGEKHTSITHYAIPTGERGSFENILVPIRDGEGRVAYVGGASRDVTKRLELEDELREARKKADTANEAKSRFLANMSHELRTPITGILGSVQVLGLEPLTPTQEQMLASLRLSADTLLHTVNDLLDLTKVTSHGLRLELATCNLPEVTRQVVETLRPSIEAKGLDYSMHVDEGLDGMLLCDAYRIHQVLRNLLSNALKFTASGSITVEMVLGDEPCSSDDEQHIVLRVVDTGPGIPKDKLDSLFQEFTQLDDTYAKKFGGTGLGLAISRRLAELMGGTLEVESVEGEGATFSLHMCLQRCDEGQECAVSTSDAPASPALCPLHLLVAEDNQVNRLFMQRVLEHLGHTARFVENGRFALEALEEERFDAIIMDMQMPEMDGLTAIGHIRKADAWYADLPVLALTAYALEEDRQKIEAAGTDGFLTKPFSMEQLEASLYGLFEEAQAGPGAAAQSDDDEAACSLLAEHTAVSFARHRPELVQAMYESFTTESRASLDRLASALDAGDRTEAAAAAHYVASGAMARACIDLASACCRRSVVWARSWNTPRIWTGCATCWSAPSRPLPARCSSPDRASRKDGSQAR